MPDMISISSRATSGLFDVFFSRESIEIENTSFVLEKKSDQQCITTANSSLYESITDSQRPMDQKIDVKSFSP